MQKINGKMCHVIIPTEMMEKITRIQERHGLRQAETLRRVMGLGVDVYEDFEKIGVVKLADVVLKTRKIMSQNVGQGQLFPESE